MRARLNKKATAVAAQFGFLLLMLNLGLFGPGLLRQGWL
jgi:nitrate reductase NapE component